MYKLYSTLLNRCSNQPIITHNLKKGMHLTCRVTAYELNFNLKRLVSTHFRGFLLVSFIRLKRSWRFWNVAQHVKYMSIIFFPEKSIVFGPNGWLKHGPYFLKDSILLARKGKEHTNHRWYGIFLDVCTYWTQEKLDNDFILSSKPYTFYIQSTWCIFYICFNICITMITWN